MGFAAKVKSVQKQEISKPPEQWPKTRACSRMAAAAGGEARQVLESTMGVWPTRRSWCGWQRPAVPLERTGREHDGWPRARLLGKRQADYGGRLDDRLRALQRHIADGGPEDVARELLESDADSLAKVKDLLWSITQRQGELVYIPVGWILAEKVMDRKDIAGFLCRGISGHDAKSALNHLKGMSQDQEKTRARRISAHRQSQSRKAQLHQLAKK